MKISGSRINQFLRQPDPKAAAVLLFGPDQGLVRERAEELVLNVVDDPADPFRVSVLTGADIKADPPCLVDEAAQLSMTGGHRVIWVHETTDGLSRIFESYFDNTGHDNLVIVEAGTLSPQSSLRKLFEKSSHGVSIGCYEDDAMELEAVVRETLGRHGLSPTAEARDYLVENLGSDRRVTRSELEKLALYALSGTANRGGAGSARAALQVAAARVACCSKVQSKRQSAVRRKPCSRKTAQTTATTCSSDSPRAAVAAGLGRRVSMRRSAR